jgi:hypothetical protein
MKNDSLLPCRELSDVLRPAYNPCHGFESICTSMRWIPANGHVPRGFCGALGQLDNVELVLIVAEPGDPHSGESYSADSPDEWLAAVSKRVYECFEKGTDLYHRNIREILNKCWDGLPFAEQMRRTWITESVLCSAQRECGSVPAKISRHCVDAYLRKQLSMLSHATLSHATIATLGRKAKNRTVRLECALGQKFINAFAAAPPGCYRREAKPSWDRIAVEVRRRSKPDGAPS